MRFLKIKFVRKKSILKWFLVFFKVKIVKFKILVYDELLFLVFIIEEG